MLGLIGPERHRELGESHTVDGGTWILDLGCSISHVH